MSNFPERLLVRILRDAIFGRGKRKSHPRQLPAVKVTSEQMEQLGNRLVILNTKMPPAWAIMPEWTGPKLWTSVRSTTNIEVNLQEYSCTCEEWQKQRSTFRERDIHRCCRHVAQALFSNSEIVFGWQNPWTRAVALGLRDWGIPVEFEQGVFSNGLEEFLCFYATDTGYVQVHAASGGFHFGLSIGSNANNDRWANEYRPPHCVALKKEMRPWVLAMHAKWSHR